MPHATPMIMPQVGPARKAQFGSGEIGAYREEIGAEDPRSVEELIDRVYAALRSGVVFYGTKQSEFADDMGRTAGDVSYRLRRASKNGEVQKAHLDYIGFLAKRPRAREAFLKALANDWGFKLEPLAPSPVQLLRIVAADLSEGRRRELEENHGLPPGSLDA